MKPVLLVGPSGVGKSTLIKHLIENYNFQKIVTATTRPMRSGEQNGVHYYFLSEKEYQQWFDEGKFFMDNHFLNARYGTITKEVDDIIKSGNYGIMETFVTTVTQFKLKFPDTVVIYLKPESLEQIENRMRERGDSDETIQNRLESAKKEIQTIEENIELFDQTIDVGSMTPEQIANELIKFLIRL